MHQRRWAFFTNNIAFFGVDGVPEHPHHYSHRDFCAFCRYGVAEARIDLTASIRLVRYSSAKLEYSHKLRIRSMERHFSVITTHKVTDASRSKMEELAILNLRGPERVRGRHQGYKTTWAST